jgi:hypothetical protein
VPGQVLPSLASEYFHTVFKPFHLASMYTDSGLPLYLASMYTDSGLPFHLASMYTD